MDGDRPSAPSTGARGAFVMLMSSPVAHVRAHRPPCCLVKMRYLQSKKNKKQKKRLRVLTTYGAIMGFAVRRGSLGAPCMEREWREERTPSSKTWIFIPVAACQCHGPVLSTLHSKGTVERIIVVGQSPFRPVIVLFLPHFCHSSAFLLKLSALLFRMLMFCRHPYVCVLFAARHD